MEPPALLVLPDYSIGHLEFNGLSDQKLMELLIENMHMRPKRQFRDETGAYKDACKWPGVECNGRRCVINIQWTDSYLKQSPLTGTVDVRFIPPRTQKFVLYDSDKRSTCTISGTVDTAALPRSLKTFYIPSQRFHGTFDFRRMPPALVFAIISINSFEGRLDLSNLPKTLEKLDASRNYFHRSISLTHLPQGLDELLISHNQLCGALFLSHLPNGLVELVLSHNAFSGSVHFDRLPSMLEKVDLSWNSLSGSFVLRDPPFDLRHFNAQHNRFSGTAIIEHRVLHAVGLGFTNIEAAVEKHGRPVVIPELYNDMY